MLRLYYPRHDYSIMSVAPERCVGILIGPAIVCVFLAIVVCAVVAVVVGAARAIDVFGVVSSGMLLLLLLMLSMYVPALLTLRLVL